MLRIADVVVPRIVGDTYLVGTIVDISRLRRDVFGGFFAMLPPNERLNP